MMMYHVSHNKTHAHVISIIIKYNFIVINMKHMLAASNILPCFIFHPDRNKGARSTSKLSLTTKTEGMKTAAQVRPNDIPNY